MPEERWQKVRTFISEWFEPLGDSDGYSEEEIAEAEARLGIRLPEALREWYGFAGKRIDFYKQNWMIPISDLYICKNTLYAWSENQSVCFWGILSTDLNQDDCPVYVEDSDGKTGWQVSNTIEDFVFSFLINEYPFSAPYSFSEVGVEGPINHLKKTGERVYLPLNIQCLTDCIGENGDGSVFLNSEMEFYRLRNSICTWKTYKIPESNGFSSIRIGAKSHESLQEVISLLGLKRKI